MMSDMATKPKTQTIRLRVEIDVDPDAYRDLYDLPDDVDLADDVAAYLVELVEVCKAHAGGGLVARTVRPVKR